MIGDRPLYIDACSFEETDDFDIFIYRGVEMPIVTSGGAHHLCKDGDRLQLDGDEGDWLEIVDVLPAILN